MAIEAPFSKHKKNTFLILIAACLAIGAYCVYDGYINKNFIEKHTDSEGRPDSSLAFNQKSPPFFLAAAILLALRLYTTKGKKIIADDDNLVISKNLEIPYGSIQKIDKTHFESKGRFTITYTNAADSEKNLTLSDRNYDNLGKILDLLVEKIT